MKFKLDLNESLFNDSFEIDEEPSIKVFSEGHFSDYADVDDDFSELDYELYNSDAIVSKVDSSSNIPEGPQPGPNTGIADLLIAAINDEWEAIRSYNSLVSTLAFESANNPQFARMIDVINDINSEENKHVGQLQEILKILSPNASLIKEGEQEGRQQFNFVNGKLPVQNAVSIAPTEEATDNVVDTNCTINDIDDEW